MPTSSRERELSAYVLHQRPYGDTSKVLELFTRERGRIGAMAKGIRQSQYGNVLPFQCYRVCLTGRGELPIMKQAEVDSPPQWLQGEAALAGLYLNELLLHLLPRDDPHPELFLAYQQTLARMHRDLAPALRHMEWQLLVAMGYAPDLERDVEGKPIRSDLRYTLDAQRGFSHGDDGEWGGNMIAALATGGDAEAAEQRRLLRYLLSLHLEGKVLKSWGMLHHLRELTRSV